jgi:DNA polymerase III delta subunit
MIILIHGDHIEASRAELNRLKEEYKDKEIRVLDGRTVTETNLVQSLESSSLFGGDTCIIVDRLFSGMGKQLKRIEALAKVFVASGESSTIVLWEDKEVGTTVIKNLGDKVSVKVFKLPVLIFQFLDSLRPDNAKMLLSLYTDLTASEAPELVFSMMAKRVRQLIQLSDGGQPVGVAPWQLVRLTTQAKSFTMEKLLESYNKMHDIEVHIKTGMSPFPLKAATEQLLITL